MASEKQVAANRQNAVKSTGPKSAAGKKIARRNAVKHGLQAEHVVLPGEDPEEFEEFFRSLQEDWRPVGARENLLLEEIVDGRWQLRRARIIRTARMRKEHLMLERAESQRKKDIVSSRKFRDMSTKELALLYKRQIHASGPRDFEVFNSEEEIKQAEAILEKFDHAEDGAVQDSLSKDKEGDPLSTLAVVYRRSAKDLEMVSRYEKEITSRLRGAERELERIQAARRAEAAVTATVIDITDLNDEEG